MKKEEIPWQIASGWGFGRVGMKKNSSLNLIDIPWCRLKTCFNSQFEGGWKYFYVVPFTYRIHKKLEA